ncbi:unnamed protein product [Cuscuta europaea]|uniref:SHSP domain-containing protein n=1 Tax=Cuscuta europaea TaxID=41803 RepID=A0A9P0YPJ9_CUSEU|nr:unnamed protein product [Cuscuta europaea]
MAEGNEETPPFYNYEDLTPEWTVNIGPIYDTLILHLPAGFTKDNVSIGVSIKEGEEKFVTISGHKLGEDKKWLRFYKQFKVSINCDLSRMYATFENDEKDHRLRLLQFKPSAMEEEEVFAVVDDVDPAAILAYMDHFHVPRFEHTEGVHADAITIDIPPGTKDDDVAVEVKNGYPYIAITAHRPRRGGRISYVNEVYNRPSRFRGWVRFFSYLGGHGFLRYDMSRSEIKIEKGEIHVTLHKHVIPAASVDGSAAQQKEMVADDLDGPKSIVEKIEIMEDYTAEESVPTAAQLDKEEPRRMRMMMTTIVVLFAIGMAGLFVNKRT